MGGMAGAVIAAIIIGTLYVGREIFIPIALAILLSFALAPLVRLLQRLRFTWSSFWIHELDLAFRDGDPARRGIGHRD
jgi:predicted PurR-regulated permease PerM